MIPFSPQATRLYAVSKRSYEKGLYKLIPFETEEFNQMFDAKCIGEKLDRLCGKVRGGARCFEIIDDMYDNDGNIHIQIDSEKEIVIRDISEKIETALGKSKYYILVNRDGTKHSWIVTESLATIYWMRYL